MRKPYLIITEERGAYRIAWYLPEDGDIGGSLGQDKNDGIGDTPNDDGDWEHWAASKAVRATGARRDSMSFCWDSRSEAAAALRFAKAALKQERPLPEWATKALAEGWPMPKGWKP
jgi:hypothetical protein